MQLLHPESSLKRQKRTSMISINKPLPVMQLKEAIFKSFFKLHKVALEQVSHLL